MRAALLAMAAVAVLAGCCAKPVYVTRPLPLPSRPILPAVLADELTCLPYDTYAKIVERERMRREYAETLEAIIKATHEDNR